MGVMEKRRLIALNEPHLAVATPAGVANVSTDMVGKLAQCKVEFAPVQSGTGDPSPTNIRPITGWTGVTAYRTGKNLIDKTRSANGTYDQTTGEAISSSYQYQTRIEYDIPVAPGEKFIHSNANNNNGRAFFWKQSGEYVGTQLCTSGTAFTIPSNAGKMRFVSSSEGWMLDSRKWQLEKGSTATTYEAYTGISCPVSWTEQGTVYGGYVDMVTGELVATHGLQEMDGETASKRFDAQGGRSGTAPYNYYFNFLEASTLGGTVRVILKEELDAQHIISTHYPSNAYNVADNLPCFGVYIGSNGNRFQPRIGWPYSSGIDTVTKANNWLKEQYNNGTPFCFTYPLRNIIRYQLTPQQIKTLIGQNNIWSNANGDITIKYWKH